jgi:hypothetical protein
LALVNVKLQLKLVPLVSIVRPAVELNVIVPDDVHVGVIFVMFIEPLIDNVEVPANVIVPDAAETVKSKHVDPPPNVTVYGPG